MLAIVCKNYAAAYQLESNTLPEFALRFGQSVKGGYLALCLEDIRYTIQFPLFHQSRDNVRKCSRIIFYAFIISARFLKSQSIDRTTIREPSVDPQGLIPLQKPTLPNGNIPQGFLGYAVNMISIDASHLHWRTKNGRGLRETLFYRLFGELQVYKDRECMMTAQSCIQDGGALSLDGGIIRGNGLVSFGHWYEHNKLAMILIFPIF